MLREAKRLGLKICLYDEWWFPRGWAGGILQREHPEACAKRLDMEEYTAEGKRFSLALPQDGKVMALVGMKGTERIDLSPFAAEGRLEWEAPAENWIALCFILRDSGWNHVDYLSAEAVQKFIDCTHEVYYRHFSEYFGKIVPMGWACQMLDDKDLSLFLCVVSDSRKSHFSRRILRKCIAL